MRTTPAVRGAQFAIAALSLTFGFACLTAPDAVAGIAARNAFSVTPIVFVAAAALGAHAIAVGLFAGFARPTRWSFAGLAASLLPIFAADCWLYAKTQAFNGLLLAHAGALLAIAALCVQAFLWLQREERIAEQMA